MLGTLPIRLRSAVLRCGCRSSNASVVRFGARGFPRRQRHRRLRARWNFRRRLHRGSTGFPFSTRTTLAVGNLHACRGAAGVASLTATSPVVYQVSLFIAEFLLFMSTGPINVVIVSVVPPTIRAMAMAEVLSPFRCSAGRFLHRLSGCLPMSAGWLARNSSFRSRSSSREFSGLRLPASALQNLGQPFCEGGWPGLRQRLPDARR